MPFTITTLDGLTVVTTPEAVQDKIASATAVSIDPARNMNGTLVRSVITDGLSIEPRPIVLPEGIRYGILNDWMDPDEVNAMRNTVTQALADGFTRIRYLFLPFGPPTRSPFVLPNGTVGMECARKDPVFKRAVEGVFVGYVAMREGDDETLWEDHNISMDSLLRALYATTTARKGDSRPTKTTIGVLINDDTLVLGFWDTIDATLTLDQLVTTYGTPIDPNMDLTGYRQQVRADMDQVMRTLTEAHRAINQLHASAARLQYATSQQPDHADVIDMGALWAPIFLTQTGELVSVGDTLMARIHANPDRQLASRFSEIDLHLDQ